MSDSNLPLDQQHIDDEVFCEENIEEEDFTGSSDEPGFAPDR